MCNSVQIIGAATRHVCSPICLFPPFPLPPPVLIEILHWVSITAKKTVTIFSRWKNFPELFFFSVKKKEPNPKKEYVFFCTFMTLRCETLSEVPKKHKAHLFFRSLETFPHSVNQRWHPFFETLNKWATSLVTIKLAFIAASHLIMTIVKRFCYDRSLPIYSLTICCFYLKLTLAYFAPCWHQKADVDCVLWWQTPTHNKKDIPI